MEALEMGNESPPTLETAPVVFGYLEVLSRSGQTVQRFPVTEAGLTLGRAFENDLVLDDPYVCPQHAQLVWTDEGPQIFDLGSVNGLSAVSGRLRKDRLPLPTGTTFRIGRTLLRYRSSDAPLLPTKPDRSTFGPLRWLENGAILGLLYVLTGSALGFQKYLDSAEKFQGSKLAASLLVVLVVGLIWTSVWSFVNRTLGHRWNFGVHFGVACLGLSGALVTETFTGYLCFSLGLDTWHRYLNYGLVLGLVCWLVYMHLRLTAAGAPAQLARTSAIVGLLLVGAVALFNQSFEADFSSSPEYQVTLKAPVFKGRGSLTPSAFFKDATRLQDQLKP